MLQLWKRVMTDLISWKISSKKESNGSGFRSTFTTVWQSDSIIRLCTEGKQHWRPLRMARLSMVFGSRTTLSPSLMLAAIITSPTLFLSMVPILALYGSTNRAPFVFNLKRTASGGCQQPIILSSRSGAKEQARKSY